MVLQEVSRWRRCLTILVFLIKADAKPFVVMPVTGHRAAKADSLAVVRDPSQLGQPPSPTDMEKALERTQVNRPTVFLAAVNFHACHSFKMPSLTLYSRPNLPIAFLRFDSCHMAPLQAKK